MALARLFDESADIEAAPQPAPDGLSIGVDPLDEGVYFFLREFGGFHHHNLLPAVIMPSTESIAGLSWRKALLLSTTTLPFGHVDWSVGSRASSTFCSPCWSHSLQSFLMSALRAAIWSLYVVRAFAVRGPRTTLFVLPPSTLIR